MARKNKKIFFISTFLILILNCYSVVFAAERFNYNNNWNDDYLGIENIKMIFRKMEYTDYNDAILNQTYDNFIIRYAEFKELYPSATLYNLVFFAMEEIIDSPTDIGVSLSNGSFSDETIPYIKMEASSSTHDVLTYVNNRNESGTLATNFQIYNGRLQNYGGIVNITQFTVDDTENDAYIIDGNIFSWNPAYTVLYRTEFGFLTNSLPGLLIDEGVFYEPEIPEEPENPDNPSGDIGSGDIGIGDITSGDVPDTEIQNSLNNIENKIPSSGDIQNIVSQETDKIINFISGDANFENENISSGDIIGSIGYEPPDDPYANFWWELTEILNNALTGTNRTLTLQAIKNTYTISIDDIGWNPPDVLRTFLTLLSTTVVCWVLIKYIKITIDKLSSGSIDEALAMNEECGIVDLF